MLVLLFTLFALSSADTSNSTENETEVETIPLILPKEGDVCNLQRMPQVTNDPSEYLKCMVPDWESEWTWNGIGVWVKNKCPAGKAFSPVSRSCKKANAVRRQYINSCGAFGGCNQQYQPVSSCGSGGCGGGAWTAQQPAQFVPPQVPSPCQGSGCGTQQVIQQPYQPVIEIQPVQPAIQPQGCGSGGCGQQQQAWSGSWGQNQGCGSAGCGQAQQVVQPQVIIEPQWGQNQGCGSGGCGQAQQVAQPQVVIEPQPCAGSSCGGQTQGCGGSGCGPVQPVQPQPCAGSSCGGQTQGCGPSGCQPVQQGCSGSSCGCQGSGCGQQVMAPRPCPGASDNFQNVQAGDSCSWMSAPLVQSQQSSGYMQCQPSTGNVYCGQWQEQSCGNNQVFNPQVQICTQPQNSQIGQQFGQPQQPCTAGTVPIGQCNVRNQCPGFSTCQENTGTCCQPWQG